MILGIVKHPDSILYEPAEAVSLPELKSGSFQTLIEDMIDTCIAAEGLGLAANQVNTSRQLFVIAGPPFLAVINPVIISRSGKMTCRGEGCLSIPEEYFTVRRSKMVIVEALNRNGELIRIKSKNKTEAQVLQHEIDHLKGKTLILTGK